MTETELLVAVGIWTICAVAAWFIATTKKAPDAAAWAFWGLLLGPLGLLGAIAFAKPRSATAGGARVCPRCQRVDFGQEGSCPNCGQPLAV